MSSCGIILNLNLSNVKISKGTNRWFLNVVASKVEGVQSTRRADARTWKQRVDRFFSRIAKRHPDSLPGVYTPSAFSANGEFRRG